MSRHYAEFTVQSDSGAALNGAIVKLYARVALTPASFYAADEGGAPLTQLVTDVHGFAAGYVVPARYVYDVIFNSVTIINKRPYDALAPPV